MKKSLKKFIFEEMDKKGFVLDSEIGKFLGDKEVNYYTSYEYEREWNNLQIQKEKFDDCEDKILHSFRNSYKNAKTKFLLRYKGLEENQYQPITKSYYEYLKEKGVKECNV